MNLSAVARALRIARRDAWRAKGRSLLVIALIGLPVIVLAGADIAYRTWQLDPQEKLTRTLGSADCIGGLGRRSGPAEPEGARRGYSTQTASNTPPPTPSTATVVSAAPPGQPRHRTAARLRLDHDPGRPKVRGVQRSGLREPHGPGPRAPGQRARPAYGRRDRVHPIACRTTPACAIGDEVRTAAPDGTFRLVGIVG